MSDDLVPDDSTELLLVTGMSLASQFLHEVLFGLPRGLRLSLAPSLDEEPVKDRRHHHNLAAPWRKA